MRMINDWIAVSKSNPSASMRLFCFHYAGGNAQFFHPWSQFLPQEVEVNAIQLAGRGHRISERLVTRLIPLSRIIARALKQYIDKPFVFFGHSLGALLCYEVARNMQRDLHIEPAHIFISATDAPHCRQNEEILSALPQQELIRKLWEFEGTTTEVLQNGEILDLLLPVIRADFEICETYKYNDGASLNCPITVYGGINDQKVDKQSLSAWNEMTTGHFKVRMFPGGHFYMNDYKSIFFRTFSHDLLQISAYL